MSREQVLARVRAALGDTHERKSLPAARPAAPHYGEARMAQFVERLEAHACTWERIAALDEVPVRVMNWLAERQLPARIAVAPPLAGLAWPDDLSRHSDKAGIDEVSAVSKAFAAIAESGSLAMYSGPDSPITHNYAPEFHIIVLDAADLRDNQEGVWEMVRATGAMPRALSLIAGPSRTGDVEQTIQLGAHGPRQVHVLIVEP